jgi:hypothetical protein
VTVVAGWNVMVVEVQCQVEVEVVSRSPLCCGKMSSMCEEGNGESEYRCDYCRVESEYMLVSLYGIMFILYVLQASDFRHVNRACSEDYVSISKEYE